MCVCVCVCVCAQCVCVCVSAQAVSLVLLASGGTVLHAGAVHVLPGAGKSPLDFLVFSIASLVPLVTFAVVGDQDSG